MRIGMLTDNLQTHISGVTNSILLVKRFLELAGHEVFIFTFDKANAINHNDHIIYTSGVPVTDFYLNIVYSPDARKILATMDIVHVHHPFFSGYLARRYCHPKNIPIVFTNHSRYDLMTQAYVPILPASIIDTGLKSYLSSFFSICNLVIVPTPSMQLVLMEYLNSQTPVVVIPHGLDLDKFQEIDQIISRQDLGFTNQDVICIYVGRLSPEKNLSFLLQAFQTVLKTNPATRLLLVGDGPERKSLETQLKELGIFHHVLITGLVSHDDVPQYLSLGDIFVTPSPAESFGLSTLEAMSVGLPVLGIDAPGTRDLVENEINGLVANNQQSDFSEKLLRLTKDASLRRKLGAQAALSSRKYDIRVTTEALIQQYERLIEGTKRYDAVAA